MKKKIWITGASSGIGKSLAIKFADEGWNVAASARRENLLQELSEENESIYSFPLDVKDSLNTKKVFNNIVEKFGSIDICVFCTGIHDPIADRKIDIDKIKEIMEINFFGTLNCISAVTKHFKEKKNGQISIVASLAGYRGLPGASGYSASKAALINLTESLYFYFKRFNVRISLVNPGFIRTPMTDKNDFPMPMMKTSEFAAERMFKGLTKKNSFEISFPKVFSFILSILKILPNWLYFKIVGTTYKLWKD